MEPRWVERRRAAIVVADLAGHSRLMAVDELGTLAPLKAHRRTLIEPNVRGPRGTIMKTTSDGAPDPPRAEGKAA